MLEQLIGNVLQGMGRSQGGGGTALLGVLAQLLSNSGPTGGLPGLVRQFQQAGMGDQMSSWISTGRNQPIDIDQLTQVFGHGRMQQFAEQAGMPVQDFGHQMSELLPQMVDRVTPTGEVPSNGLEDALGELSRLMRR